MRKRDQCVVLKRMYDASIEPRSSGYSYRLMIITSIAKPNYKSNDRYREKLNRPWYEGKYVTIMENSCIGVLIVKDNITHYTTFYNGDYKKHGVCVVSHATSNTYSYFINKKHEVCVVSHTTNNNYSYFINGNRVSHTVWWKYSKGISKLREYLNNDCYNLIMTYY